MTFVFDWNLPKTHGMLTIWSTRLIMNEWWHCSLRGLSYNGAGCNYRNKYEIASYGSESSDSIRVQVRHYQDSYIAAEEATKGCSSEFIYGVNCVSKLLATEGRTIKISSLVTSDSSTESSDTTWSKVSLGVRFWSNNFGAIEGNCLLVLILIGFYYLLYWWCCEPN